MAKTTLTSDDWTKLDPASLTPELAQLWADSKAAYRLAKEARQAFEKAMNVQAELPAGRKLVFGYNFGNLSVAIVEEEIKAAPKAGAKSLAQYLADQASR